MPGRDGTGPMGMGEMTGRGAGYCATYSNVTPGRGLGLGRGFGRGRGLRSNRPGFGTFQGYANKGAGYYQAPNMPELTPQQEAEALKNEAKFMQDEIGAINKRISELESTDKKA